MQPTPVKQRRTTLLRNLTCKVGPAWHKWPFLLRVYERDDNKLHTISWMCLDTSHLSPVTLLSRLPGLCRKNSSINSWALASHLHSEKSKQTSRCARLLSCRCWLETSCLRGAVENPIVAGILRVCNLVTKRQAK